MKKRLHFLAVLLVFVVALLCLASCQGTNSSTTTPTTMPIPSFEVVFVAGDGEILKTETVQLGQSATAPEVPDRTGYMFVGWDTDFSNVDCSMTVTAQYLRVWTVQFVDASGDEIGTFSVLDGEASPTPPIDPYKENHTFVGWDQDYSSVKSDMIIRPVFKELGKFSVTFLGFDGEVLKNQEVCQGESAIAPLAPQIQHYTFKGWDKDFSSITADLTVNAIYEEDEKYTVCFYDYDGNLLKTEKLYAGEDATAPEVPQHDDLVFLGWDKDFDNVQTDLTVTAKYLQCYTVTFKGYDGTVLKVQKVYEGEGATAPAAPIREGYIFTGWDKTFDRVTGHLEIVAQYEIVKHNVIFSVPGGEAPATQVVEHGSVAMRPADPVRDGFDFIEWRLDGKKYDFSQLVTADMTLVAYFKSNGQVPAITNDTLKIDPYELELWVGITLQLNIMPNGETYDILANTDITVDFISTDPEVISIEDDGTFTSHALGSAKIYAVVTKGGTYVGSKGTYTAEVGDVIGICYMTVVETDEYYQNFLDDPENQKITLGSTSTSRIDKNEFLVFPSGEYGSANIALWYNGTEAVFTATVDDNPNVMGDWAKWAVFADEFGIPTTFITPSLSGYANEGSLWQVISSSEYAMVQSHGATHLAINQHHSTARIWNEFYYGRKNINQTGGNDSLIIGYANGTNYAPISALFFISGRGVAGHLNSVDKINYNTLSSYSGFPNIETAMNTLLGENATNGWMSVHYHQMGNGADTIRGVYEYMYPYIEDGRLWAAIFADAAQYGQERDTATLTMLETGANVIRFTLTDQMNDILFYHPLSVRVKVDSTWTGARAYQNGEEVKVQLITKDGETYLMVDAVPDKGEVTVVRTEMTVMEQSENAIRFEAVDGLTATQAMTAQFPVAWNYAYATQRGVQIPAYVKDGVLYVTFDVNGGQVSIVPLTSQYDSLDSYTMTMVYSGYVAPDPAKSITIANAGELVMFSEYVNAGNSLAGITVELIADIDMTGVEYQGAGFNFIYKGSSGSYMVRPFSGVFEGNKHKIYNVNINQLTIDAGIFGYIKDAIVRNLSVEGNVNGGERVGGIVSYADNSLISQCSFTGNVTASVIHKNQATGRTIGGIVGMVRNGSVIEHCHFKGNVMSIPCESYDVEVYNIGGIVGSFGAGTVNNCSVYGNVIAGDNSKHVGGIVGTIEGAGEGGLRRVSNCFASVNVKGAQYVGGIIGYLSSSSSNRTANIYNCSVIGSVTANNYVGGLGGYGSGLSGTHITNCYSAVKVNAPADAVYVGTILGGFQAESYGLKIDKNYYVGSLNPDMPVSVKISGNGSFSSIDVADGAAALEALNTKANATANYNAWRLVDGIPSACYEEIYTVTFVDKNGDVITFVSLPKGFAATAPNAPLFEGFAFTGWDKAFDNITSDMTVTALYKEVSIFTVTFIGKDGIVLKTEKVNEGLAATAPTLPVIEGWRFDGWDKTFDVVNDHLMVTAKYVKTWTLTYLDQDGEVWNVEVYDEGTVPTLAIAPAVKGATFISWNPASVGAVTEDVVLTPIYQVRSATSAADYTVMHWTLGGNVIYTGNYRDNIKNAVEAADPDIVILTGMDSHTLKNPKTTFSFSEGYTCWAYGAGSSNSPAAATEAVHRYVGSGVAIYYKTDLFTPAGEVGHGFPGGDRVSQFTIFPLANNEGLVIPVVVSYMVSTATEAQRQTWVSQLKEALGEGFDTAIIRLYVEGSTSPDASWSASFNQAADENGYSLVCDGGTNVKKTQGTHNSTSTHYVFMMTYGTGEPTASLSNHTSVQITEDSTTYPNNHSTHTAFYDVAYTITFSVGATGSEE